MTTRGEWSIAFLHAIGNSNPSQETINLLSAWTAKEGTRAKYNPLATTYDLKPNTDFNSVGVKNYETLDQGIQATIKTLQGNFRGYSDILEGLRTNNPSKAMNGLGVSPWSGSNSRTYAASIMSLALVPGIANQQLVAIPGSGGMQAYYQARTKEQHDINTQAGITDAVDVQNNLASWKDALASIDTKRIAAGAVGVGLLLVMGGVITRQFVPAIKVTV